MVSVVFGYRTARFNGRLAGDIDQYLTNLTDIVCSACVNGKKIFCSAERRQFRIVWRTELAIFLQNTSMRNGLLKVKYTTQSDRLTVFIFAGIVQY